MLQRYIYLIGSLFLLCYTVLFSQLKEQLSLNDAITFAIKNNPQLISSSKQIDVESGRFWRGVSPQSPSLSVNYQYIPKGNSIKQFGERTVEISQSLDFPTNILFRGLQLSSKVSVAEAEYSSTSNDIISRVKIAYYDVLAKQKKIELAGENLAIAEDFARKADIRYNVGEATNLERLTANVQFTQARNALDVAQNDLKIAFGELYHVLGLRKEDQPDKIILTDSLVYKPITQTSEQLKERAFKINPQLIAASERVSVASIDRALAWSSFLPNLNASYYRQTVDGNSDFYGVSFGISLPLWFLFDQRGQIQEASANLNVAKSDLQSFRNFISMNVQTAYLELKNDERQIKLHQTDILPQAKEVYRTALASYEAGEITYLEFLQARQTLISSRSEFIDELALYCKSLAKLEYAIGSSVIE
ncbi:MAG: TolC family protein [Ignavibacteriales bacterium]|nr:TolC family protein [Ignavibacteriales bacterium]